MFSYMEFCRYMTDNSARVLIGTLLFGCLLVFTSSFAFAQSAFEDPASRVKGKKAGDLSVVSGKIDAGPVSLGSSSQVVVLFRNDSAAPLKSGTISLYPSSNVSASIGENECSRQSLPPGAVCAIALSVKGLQPGTFRIEMLMRHEGRSKLITTTISGIVERGEDASADVISDLETIPSELKFGRLKDSRPLTRSLVLRNVTSKTVKIISVDIESSQSSGYSYKSGCDSLLSGEACILTVIWSPQSRGPATGILVVNHDGPTGVISIPLNGEYDPSQPAKANPFPEAVPGKGLLTSSTTEIVFGTGIAASSAITASLVNVGDEPLAIRDIRLSNEDNGLQIATGGCKPGLVLDPIEACPLTLKWEPVREGSILDDVQIVHDGARGILVLPVKGTASRAVNKDSKALVFGGEAGDLLRAIPPLSSDELDGEEEKVYDVSGALEGYRITSLATDKAVISGPGGSRVIFSGEETIIGGVLMQVFVRRSAVEFLAGNQRVLLLFDRSLAALGSSNSGTTLSSDSLDAPLTPDLPESVDPDEAAGSEAAGNEE